MTLVIPDWIAENVAWVSVVGIAGGVSTYLVRRSGRKKIAKVEGPAVDWRRAEDKLLDRFLASQDKMATAIEHLADSRREEMKDLCDEMRKTTTSLLETFARGFRDVHDRIDDLVNPHARKEARRPT